jgi:hypothetical protein
MYANKWNLSPEKVEEGKRIYSGLRRELDSLEKQLGVPGQDRTWMRLKAERSSLVPREPTLSDLSNSLEDLSHDLMILGWEAEDRALEQQRELEQLREQLEEHPDRSRMRRND